jgi:hypothetical protein
MTGHSPPHPPGPPKPPAPGGSKLAVQIDGAMLDDEAARALWTEFSAHMDANQGDFAGFAKKKGWVSVAPEYRQGKAVLVARTTAAPAKPAPAKPAPAKPAQAKPSPAKGKPKAPRGNGPGKPRRGR